MIVNINNKEAAALSLHMSIMRKSFRNLIKKQYGGERAPLLQSYDYIINECKNALEGEYQIYNLNLNISDLEVLQEFLRAYIGKVTIEAEKAKSEDLNEHLNALESVRQKTLETMSA